MIRQENPFSKKMAHIVNIAELTLPAQIEYAASPEVCRALEERFEFDTIQSLSGQFTITEAKDHYVLEGSYKSLVIWEGSEINIEESVKVFLLTSSTQEALFDILDDFEILENQTFDLEEILSQYLYLYVCDNA